MRQSMDLSEVTPRSRTFPALALGLAAVLGLQAGVIASAATAGISKNTAIIAIAAAPAPISIFESESLLIWTAATLAVLLLLSRQARTSTALLAILPRRRPVQRRQSAHRQSKMSITYHSGGLYGP